MVTRQGKADDREAAERLRRLGAAIRTARGSWTQTELGEEIGEGVPQTTISRWEAGLVDLTVEQVLQVEAALGLQPGALLAEAGYVELSFKAKDVEAMLRTDPALDPDIRDEIVRAYRSFVAVSTRVRKAERGSAR